MKKMCLNKSLQISGNAPESHSANSNQQSTLPSPFKSFKNARKTSFIEQEIAEMPQIDLQCCDRTKLIKANSYDQFFLNSASFVDISASACVNLHSTLQQSSDFNNNDLLPSPEKSLTAATSLNENNNQFQKNDANCAGGNCINDEALVNLLYDQFDDTCQKQTWDKFIVECSYLAILVSDGSLKTIKNGFYFKSFQIKLFSFV